MVHHCNKCGTEYTDSGGFFDGHDFCFTCLSLVKAKKEEEQRKKREAQEKKNDPQTRQREIDYYKREKAAREAMQKKQEEYERRIKQLAEEKRARQLEQTERSRRQLEEQKYFDQDKFRRNLPSWAKSESEGQAERNRLEMIEKIVLDEKRRKPNYYDSPDAQSKTERKGGRLDAQQRQETEHKYCPSCKGKLPEKAKYCRQCGKSFEKPTELHLEVETSLPVSLSVGQVGVKAILLAINPNPQPLSVDLSVIVFDSAQKTIEAQIAPRSFSMPPDSRTQATVTFDLQPDTPTGPLTLSGYLQSASARSNAISILSNVKLPMDLRYRPKSAKVGGKLENYICLTFDNLGESGGLLSTSSRIEFATLQQEKKTAMLQQQAKIKGLEKGVELQFGPTRQNVQFGKILYFLVGADSNGKPYKSRGNSESGEEREEAEKQGKGKPKR
ncbi:hypothetical protein FJZ26_00110 [Candidatus Parvarchaeota archaeon]|nr:hypothetical protein [Candidatus Parvarchaeota archaeon]